MPKSKLPILNLSRAKTNALIRKIGRDTERHILTLNWRANARCRLLSELLRVGEISAVANDRKIKRRYKGIGTSRRALHELLQRFVSGDYRVTALDYGKPIPKSHPKALSLEVRSLILKKHRMGNSIRVIQRELKLGKIKVSVSGIQKTIRRATQE